MAGTCLMDLSRNVNVEVVASIADLCTELSKPSDCLNVPFLIEPCLSFFAIDSYFEDNQD